MFDVVMDDIENLIEDVKRYKKSRGEYRSGTTCPKCRRQRCGTIDSRYINGFQQRRRECENCGYRWNTIEIVEG